MVWGTTIADPDTRRVKLQQGFELWSRMDAGAATSWLESSPLDAAERQAVLQPGLR